MIYKVLSVKEPTLRQKSKPVKKLDKRIKRLIVDMKKTLRAQKDPEGIGLAAPQVGKNLRIFMMKPGEKIEVIINPEVIEKKNKLKVSGRKGAKESPKSKEKLEHKEKIMEGCLSLPHFYGPLKRAELIKIRFLDDKGKEKVKTFKGLKAQIVQHEIDHLNGILFVDRLLEQKGRLYEYANGQWSEVELV